MKSFFVYVCLVLAILLLSAPCGYSEELNEPAPTSQPTIFFIAPSVPEEFDASGSVPTTVINHSTYPTIAPSGSQDGTGSTFKDEIIEENRTAINTSSYIFYTFIGLIGAVGMVYYFKR